MINHRDILQLCRLCLVEEKVNHPIFEEAGDLRSIFLKITSCLPVSIRKDDSLPKKICDSCISKLDSLYEFWNETANAEKQMLQWLNESALNSVSKITPTEAIKNKMENTQVKEEIDIGDTKAEAIEMSSEAQTYILQQQQLPYSSIPPKIIPTPDDTEEPAPKRPRRASAMKALEQMETDEEDDDFGAENFAKSETEDSDKEGGEETYAEPSTSMDDQPGPSGMGKGTTEAPLLQHFKPCKVILNDVKHLLDAKGIYKVSEKRSRWFTCYQCSQKFSSGEDLKVHREIHELEDDGLDGNESDENSVSKRTKKIKKGSDIVENSECVVARVQQKPSKVASTSVADSPKQVNESRFMNDISIKCGPCGLTFVEIKKLMAHVPLNSQKPCCFTCEICAKGFAKPDDYLDHMMTHDDFVKKIFPHRYDDKEVGSQKYMYTCTLCKKKFGDCYELRRHEIFVHGIKEQQIYKSEDNRPKICVIKDVKSMAPADTQLSTSSNATGKTVEKFIDKSKSSMRTMKRIGKKTALKRLIIERTIIGNDQATKKVNNSEGMTISFNVLRDSEILNVAKASNPVPFQVTVESSGQTNSLVCDVCFDVFTNTESFEEHMEFHFANLDSSRVSNEKNERINSSPNNRKEIKEPKIEIEEIKKFAQPKCVQLLINNTTTSSTSKNEQNRVENKLTKNVVIENGLCSKKTPSGKQSFPCTYSSKFPTRGTPKHHQNVGKSIPDDEDSDVLFIDESSTVESDNVTKKTFSINGDGIVESKKIAEETIESEKSATVKVRKFLRQCPDCQISFKRHKSLRLHINKFACLVCSYTNCRLLPARAHMLNVHSIHYCWKCRKSFDTADLLKTHNDIEHKCVKIKKP